jgi:hypothetical protein
MEIRKLISALEEILVHLRNSESSDYSHTPVEVIIQKLEAEVAKGNNSQPMDTKLLEFLFAPTGPIQETAIDNGWGNEYLRISNVVDKFIEAN